MLVFIRRLQVWCFFSHSGNTYLLLLLFRLTEFVWDFGLWLLFAKYLFATAPQKVCFQRESVLAASHPCAAVGTGLCGVCCRQPWDGVLPRAPCCWGCLPALRECSSPQMAPSPFSLLWASRKHHGDLLCPSALQCADPVPSTSCSRVIPLGTFAACRWTFPIWKALFPALCEDLKGFIKSGVLTLQSHCILELATSIVFSIMQLIYMWKRLLLIPGFGFGN